MYRKCFLLFLLILTTNHSLAQDNPFEKTRIYAYYLCHIRANDQAFFSEIRGNGMELGKVYPKYRKYVIQHGLKPSDEDDFNQCWGSDDQEFVKDQVLDSIKGGWKALEIKGDVAN